MQFSYQWFNVFGPLVLEFIKKKNTVDKNQTTSRRFKPNSRSALIDEQSNP